MVANGISGLNFVCHTVNFSVLINGPPVGYFNLQRGLRQGDPLFPFLFLLLILNNMIKITNKEGWLRGFEVARVGRDRLKITHFLYADYTLIYCDAKAVHLKILRLVLVIFE